MKTFIVPVVEGKTEQGLALKELLERVWYKLLGYWQPLSVQPSVRGKRDLLVVPTTSGELAERVRQANNDLLECLADDAEYRGLILLLLDSEQTCPAELAPVLIAAVRDQCPHIANVVCVLAVKEFENWLVAGASGFAGKPDLRLPDPLVLPSNPEVRKGSAWLTEQRQKVGRDLTYTKHATRPTSFARWTSRPPAPARPRSTNSAASWKSSSHHPSKSRRRAGSPSAFLPAR